MWQEYLAYLIIAAAFFWAGRSIFLALRNAKDASACANCTADCKLRELKRLSQKEKRRNCTQKKENGHKKLRD